MFIYKTTNLISGKIYIGQCAREKYIDNYLGSGTWIKHAISYYGKENFKREIIEDNILDINILNEKEKYWIKFYNATNPDIGYNLVEGGDGTIGYHHREDSKKKMSEHRMGMIITEKWRQHMRESARDQSGERNLRFGKHYTDEEKMAKSIQQRGINSSAYHQKTGKSSKYRGVSWQEKEQRWRCRINLNGKQIYLGKFKTEIEAAMAYNEFVMDYYGWKEKINEIPMEDILKMWEDAENEN